MGGALDLFAMNLIEFHFKEFISEQRDHIGEVKAFTYEQSYHAVEVKELIAESRYHTVKV